MKVLATGAGGFVVGAFMRQLLRRHPDCTVMGIDLPAAGGSTSHAAPRLTKHADVTDRGQVSEIMAAFRPDVVVHGAAMTLVAGDEYSAGERFLETNVRGALNVAIAACESGTVHKFVHLSTGSVYGQQDPPILDPISSVTKPRDYYGITKLSGELIAQRTCELKGVPFIALRLSNVFGGDERPNPLRLRASLPTQAAWAKWQGRRPRVAESTLRAASDWINSSDVGDAIVAACLTESSGAQTFNVASGQVISVAELCRMIDLDVRVVASETALDDRAGDLVGGGMNAANYDITATTQALGWEPPAFADQIHDLVAWCEATKPTTKSDR
jgi:Nucleoside-diphosphate-sugar epimerases